MALCACGCRRVVTGRGRYATRRCWALAMNAAWSPERKAARAVKAGEAATRAADARRVLQARSATSRFL
jgi:hypothetical protein